MTVEEARDVERKVAGDPHAHRSHDRVQHVPVVVQELLSARFDEPVVGVAAGWPAMRRIRDEGAALLHAGEHAGHALGALQATVVGLDQFFFADATWCGQDGEPEFFGRPSHPGLVDVGALLEHGGLDAVDADDILEKVDQVLWPLQPLDVAAQDNTIPARAECLNTLILISGAFPCHRRLRHTAHAAEVHLGATQRALQLSGLPG